MPPFDGPVTPSDPSHPSYEAAVRMIGCRTYWEFHEAMDDEVDASVYALTHEAFVHLLPFLALCAVLHPNDVNESGLIQTLVPDPRIPQEEVQVQRIIDACDEWRITIAKRFLRHIVERWPDEPDAFVASYGLAGVWK